ncbi:hypothetical protein O9993_00015 [Vibrio lentus]|nr:hypothetical protein [Vibrio lentus]
MEHDLQVDSNSLSRNPPWSSIVSVSPRVFRMKIEVNVRPRFTFPLGSVHSVSTIRPSLSELVDHAGYPTCEPKWMLRTCFW